MKFSRHSDEVDCGKPLINPNWKEGDAEDIKHCICQRTRDHGGDCMPTAKPAADADGVRWCCRVPLESAHADWCWIAKKAT